MLSDFRKSVNYIIYERTTSPFWGAFIFSWLICNWKIVFTVFVVSENQLQVNKIDYISTNFLDWWPIAIYPFISTTILILIFPVIGNGAYWITIIYSKWRLNKKHEVDKKQLLSIEESIALRTAVNQIQDSYIKINSDKDAEIGKLKLEINELNNRINQSIPVEEIISKDNPKTQYDEWNEDYDGFKTSAKINEFQNLLGDINSIREINNYYTDKSALVYFHGIGLINKNSSGYSYDLTEKGIYFSKLFNKEMFEITGVKNK